MSLPPIRRSFPPCLLRTSRFRPSVGSAAMSGRFSAIPRKRPWAARCRFARSRRLHSQTDFAGQPVSDSAARTGEPAMNRCPILPVVEADPAVRRFSARSLKGRCCAAASNRFLTVAAPIGTARVSERFRDSANSCGQRTSIVTWRIPSDEAAIRRPHAPRARASGLACVATRLPHDSRLRKEAIRSYD